MAGCCQGSTTFPKAKTSSKEGNGDCWSSTGLIPHSFIKPGEIITVEKYCREIDEIHQKLTPKQPALVNRKGPILLHDNARPHVSMIFVRSCT